MRLEVCFKDEPNKMFEFDHWKISEGQIVIDRIIDHVIYKTIVAPGVWIYIKEYA